MPEDHFSTKYVYMCSSICFAVPYEFLNSMYIIIIIPMVLHVGVIFRCMFSLLHLAHIIVNVCLLYRYVWARSIAFPSSSASSHTALYTRCKLAHKMLIGLYG